MATLAEIRAKLLAQDKKAENAANKTQGSDALYPFWSMQTDETAVLRFLPDANESNDFFWRERQMIKIPFAGIKGIDPNKQIIIQVPCVEMWGDQCPVHAEIRPWYKDPSTEKLASQYWKKRSYLLQGFVVTDPLNEKEKPENPIRRFIFSPQLFKILKGALMDPDMENIPTDYESGTDFRIVQTKNGQYADYGTSSWARKERSLNETERSAVEQFGLSDLNEFLPKKPNSEELSAIMEMFEASVDGQLYDPEKWANYYRPYGIDLGEFNPKSGGNTTPIQKSKPSTPSKEEVDDTPSDSNDEAEANVAAAVTQSAPKQSASDILAAIRARNVK